MMKDITEEDINKVVKNAINLPFEKIMSDLNLGKLPNVEPVILSNGYGAGMSIDRFDNGKIKRRIGHVYVSNPNGNVDPAIADDIALRILGKGYIFIGPMSIKGIFHYMKDLL